MTQGSNDQRAQRYADALTSVLGPGLRPKSVEAVMAVADAELTQARGQRDDLAKALGDLLVHLGITRPTPLTGPELLHFANDAMTVNFTGFAGQRDALAREMGDLLRHLGVTLPASPDPLDLLLGVYAAKAAHAAKEDS